MAISSTAAASDNQSSPEVFPLYRTHWGTAYVGDSLEGMKQHLDDASVSLFFMSPPFALHHEKEYGNQTEADYAEWFRQFALVMWDKLRDDGSLVIDLGGAWLPGSPTRSLYQFKVLIDLCENLGERNFKLAQEFYWYNPSKMPLPAQWVNVERIRVKDSVNVMWWLSKTDRPKAHNEKVLVPYSPAMERLLKRQTYNGGRRPGGHNVNPQTWKKRHAGAITPNLFELPAADEITGNDEVLTNLLPVGGSESASRYHRACAALEEQFANHVGRGRFRKHPARIPIQLPTFFIRFLTDENDLVVDPFAGSNVTGHAAEIEQRRWRAFELQRHYLEPSLARFDAYLNGELQWLDQTTVPLLDFVDQVKLSAPKRA